MNEAIAGLLIIIAAGILIATVRRGSRKPRPNIERSKDSGIDDVDFDDVLPNASSDSEHDIGVADGNDAHTSHHE